MTERRLIFIVNEFSTKGKKSSHEIRQTMQRYSNDYEIHLTRYKRHATSLAEQLAAGIQKNSLIVAVGGDGTLNEVVKGLVNGNHSLPLAYVPTGSGNDFARSMNLPLTIEGSIRNIMETGTAESTGCAGLEGARIYQMSWLSTVSDSVWTARSFTESIRQKTSRRSANFLI
ncbi:MAG: acylglycerol kinase family protein [Alkalibacterium sp.]|nr:acylglycerol kinase family protein [Alkalibacterium sp.]